VHASSPPPWKDHVEVLCLRHPNAVIINMTHPLTTKSSIDEIVDNFSFLDDWEDRYGYLIELGRMLLPLSDEEMGEENKVQGCVSQVWVVSEPRDKDGKLNFRGSSDAHIVKGLVAITLTLFSGKTPEEIVALDEKETFTAIGLEEHLTPQRANGLRSMVKRLKMIASNCQ